MSDDPLWTWKGRRVRSPGDRPDSVARKVPGVIRPGSLFFVPSPLDGWGLDVLLDRLPPDSVVVVLEKDPELEAAWRDRWCQFLGPRLGDPRLLRLEADTEDAVRTLFRRLPLHHLRRCEFLPLNGAWLAFAARYREVFARIDQGLVRWWSNRITCMHMGPLWIRNLFDNLSDYQLRQSPWPDWGEDPVFVCGAGTSLESALPWLRDHRRSWRLVSADTALPILNDWSLVPDAVVCLESQHANLRDFAGSKDLETLLFTDLTSFPSGNRLFSHPPCWFITRFAELEMWNRGPWAEGSVPLLPPLGSVGVAAAWIAWKLTRGPVVLAGLDFSFPVGKTHSRGAPALSALLAATHRFQPVEQGGTWFATGLHTRPNGWLTTSVMEGYAEVLADQALAHSHRTWVWDLQGVSLGLSPWPRAVPPSLPPSPERVARELPLREWVISERQRLEQVLELFQIINVRPNDEVWFELEKNLRALDYLTFTFPDPQYRPETDWLARAQAQVRWLLGRLQARAPSSAGEPTD